jgi:hypothetical protein
MGDNSIKYPRFVRRQHREKMNLKILEMKKIYLFVFLFIASTNGNSQPIMVVQPDTIDFGQVEYASEQSRTALIYNTGNEPLLISNVTSSCGCTVPTWTQEPINPEDSSEIVVRYNTYSMGPFKKTVTVYSNDSIRSPKRIPVIGEVINSTGIEDFKESKKKYSIFIKDNFLEISTLSHYVSNETFYQLIDINGKLINQGQIAIPSNINIGNLPTGIYILFLRQKPNEQELFKFSKF